MKPVLLFVTLMVVSAVFPSRARASLGATLSKPFPVTITDDLGNRVRLAHQPKRIVSLDPRDTETLFALGMEKRVVADGSKYAEGASGISTNFSYPAQWPSRLGRDYPTRSKSLPHIEGGFGTTPFDLESIERLQPDLVVSLNSDQPTLQRMRDLGLKVVVIDPANIKGILADIALLGRATGATKQAKSITATMKRQLATIRSRISHARGRPRVYYEIDATNPLQPYTAGPGSYIDQTIGLSGGKNVADGVKSCSGKACYPQLGLESLVRLNPQVIVLGDAQYGTTVDSVKARSGWSTIAAVQSGRIFPFDDELISRAGPRIMVGLKQLARLIHPQAFR